MDRTAEEFVHELPDGRWFVGDFRRTTPDDAEVFLGEPREVIRYPGNGDRVDGDNHSVDATAELLDVIRDLCRFATAFRAVGDESWAEALIEQSAELLGHRARLLMKLRADAVPNRRASARRGVRNIRGTEWTN